jgi:succinate dehydrogenase flavin-adding protein (antitoxin of CptAB toxin-antitoxin module)
MDTRLATLTAAQVDAFEALLEYEDTDFWALLTRRQECPDPRQAEIVELLRVV